MFRRLTDWLWDHFERVALLVGWAVTGGLFAWAAKAAKILEPYSPFSWVLAGFAGMFLVAVTYRIGVAAYRQQVRTRYDAKLLAQGGAIDPLAKTFEAKRIFLNEFILPSHPLVDGKTFIDCQIIGPANVILVEGNSVNEQRLPYCDAVLMHEDRRPVNGLAFTNCTFRQCSFQRVTLLIPNSEYPSARNVNWLNWITPHPDGVNQIRLPLPLNGPESLAPSSPVDEANEAAASNSTSPPGSA